MPSKGDANAPYFTAKLQRPHKDGIEFAGVGVVECSAVAGHMISDQRASAPWLNVMRDMQALVWVVEFFEHLGDCLQGAGSNLFAKLLFKPTHQIGRVCAGEVNDTTDGPIKEAH